MAGEGVALPAFNQNFYFQDTGDVGRKGLNEGGDGEFFSQDARAVAVGKGSVNVDDGEARIDEVDAANVGSRWKRVRRSLVEIEGDEGAKQFFGALLANRGHRDLSGLRAEDADVVVSDEESNPFGGSGDGCDDGARVDGGDGSGGSASPHAPGVDTHPQYSC